MRTGSIRPGDIVYANKKGHLFHAKVLGAGDGGVLIVEPIERNISYRQLKASEISEHWTHTVATRRENRRPPAQTTFDLSLRADQPRHVHAGQHDARRGRSGAQPARAGSSGGDVAGAARERTVTLETGQFLVAAEDLP